MKLSSRRKAIAITAGLALVAGTSPAFGIDPDTDPRSFGDIVAALVPGEDNVIPNNEDLYLGTHYSVRKKDDGKLLYSWGQAVKKPTDIRFVAHLPLPDTWKDAEGKGLKVTKAELRVKHSVTNNPNDQIRPEDWENEGATGLQPEYKKVDAETDTEKWLSTRGCYEGDGDYIPAGTVLRDLSKDIPGALSSDLLGGYSNAWYTTIDRDPFAWAYKTTSGDMVGSQTPNPDLGEFKVGPRWRLINGKFGQNLPHLDMPKPLDTDPNNPACIPPPYEKGELKFETGAEVVTTINLLDWKQDAPNARWLNADGSVDAQSPLAYTSGWTTTWSGKDTIPGQVIENETADLTDEDAGRCWIGSVATDDCVTTNGTKLTPDFDVSFFVKGDMKPVRMYWVELYVETEDQAPGDAEPVTHHFSTEDIVADAQGTTDVDNINVIKDGDDLDGDGDSDETVTGDTMVGKLDGSKASATLNPIDSGFTYGIQDFEYAFLIDRDGVAEEGWAVDYLDTKGTDDDATDDETALLVADTETLLMKTLNLVGTWGAGLGGATVKTSTEQFTVMEHVLSCYQTVPYLWWQTEEDYLEYLADPENPELASVPDQWSPDVCEGTRLPNPFLPEAFLPPAAASLPVLGTTDQADGVLMPTELVQGSTYAVPVAVIGTGTLTASFDWNDDGDFADANEALVPIEDAQGLRQVQVDVPADAALGVISTKFVVTGTGGTVGEVETYDATITASSTTPPSLAGIPVPAATTTTPPPAATTVPPPAATTPVVPTAVVTATAVNNGTKLFVDVDPNKGKGYWNIKVYRKVVKGDKVSWKKVGKTLRTKTSKETRTIKLRKGTYRVQVMARYKMQGAVSNEVTLGKSKAAVQPAPVDTTATPTLADVLKMYPAVG